ncbi:putative serine protease PepD [Catenuloplanes nepalensis]|uniref:Serine protease PepD n=1 Tax=Catenuloplanes nepalensis TaxID=587533 RepID=A0ABT9N1I7_9ACTN|nr:trypsin-like peptidase domain-containing protein [Catenuloplanes nepalensis]MDP9797552.1 putative serine protease PepD [Catenuloplanes nepalensis]
MNEHETTPEGQQAPAGEAQGTPAEGYRHPAEGLRGPSGSSDETARPHQAEPVTQPVPTNLVPPAAGPGSAGRPGYGQYPPSPWAAPAVAQTSQMPPAVAPTSAQPTSAPASQWAQQPVAAGAYQPGAYQQPGGYPGQGHPGQPGVPGQPPVPPWAGGPVGPVPPPQSQPGDRRFGRFAATAAAAVVLALAAGTVGAVTANAMDDDTPGVNTTNTANGEPAPVVDRSSLASIAAAVQDSVVSITTDTGEGSGVVLTEDGYILSNNHVVGGAQGGRVTVVFADGTKAEAQVVGTDARTDLGVVKAEGVSNLTAAKFGDSAAVKVGDTVLALGSPLGLQGSVTAGIISAKDRTIQVAGEEEQSPFGGGQQQAGQSIAGLLQTDAPINPGNSGGALVNTNGEVIGINTAIATSGQGSGSIGLGFAIPSNKAKEVSEALKTGQKVSHPFLGVSLTEAEGGGALVSSVSDDSPAQKAGIQRGDVITQIDGKAVNSSDDVITAVQAGKVGQQMTVTYKRNGSEKTATATLAEAS